RSVGLRARERRPRGAGPARGVVRRRALERVEVAADHEAALQRRDRLHRRALDAGAEAGPRAAVPARERATGDAAGRREAAAGDELGAEAAEALDVAIDAAAGHRQRGAV